MEEWVDGFGEDSVDLDDDVREDFVETFDFSSFGWGQLITETLIWGGHQGRLDIVECGVHIVTGSPGDEDYITLVEDTMETGGRGNCGAFGETLHVEMSPIWEFSGDESAKEGVDVLVVDVGGGQALTMSIISVEEELFKHFAGEVGIDTDEATGICGGRVLKKFGKVLILCC